MGYNVRGNDKLYVRPGNSAYTCSGSWSGNTYSWYNSEIRYQLNESGTTYTVVAFLTVTSEGKTRPPAEARGSLFS